MRSLPLVLAESVLAFAACGAEGCRIVLENDWREEWHTVSLNFLRQYPVVVLAIALVTLAMSLYPSTASAYPGPDDQCPYGWNTDTNTCLPAPSSGPGGGNMDAACQATARFDYCQSSVYIGCNSNGFETACRLLQLSYSDPNTFQQIMNAQKACTLDRDQQACDYLSQFKGIYY